MIRSKLFIQVLSIGLFMPLFLMSCNNDDEANTTKGTLKVKITDAPIDDANVKGAFVTIAAIKVDGKTINLDSKQTIEISALTNGNSETLLNQEIDAKSYSSLSLIIDNAEDAEGNSPGCYIITKDDIKHQLSSNSEAEISLNKSYEVTEDQSKEVVIDLDLRKAIRYNDDQSSDYQFASNLSASARLITKNHVVLDGEINDNFGFAEDKTIVYLYKSGTFNKEVETKTESETDVMFKGAVTSSKLTSDGKFQLHYVEEGEYTVKIITYEENSEGKYIAKAELTADILGSLNLNALDITANTSIDLNVTGSIAL